MLRSFCLAVLLATSPSLLAAQAEVGARVQLDTAVRVDMVPVAATEQVTRRKSEAPVDIITPHITDSRHLEYPTFSAPFYGEVELPVWEPVHIGGYAVDMSPTKHVVFMLAAALIVALLLVTAAVGSKKQHATKGRTHGFAGTIEAMALYLRNEVVLPNVGHHGEAFVPFALTLFFFILVCNLFGMVPYGSTATGNISVTLTLATVTAIVVEFAGIRANGIGYLSTIFYWNKELPIVMRVIMFFVMSPVEMVGKISKPFALTIRLFANMTAGHIVLLAIIGLIFTFQSWALAGIPVLLAIAISMLELFVSFLQAFIFTLLACVFIGQIRESHH